MGTQRDVAGALTEIVAGPKLADKRDFATLLGRLSIHYWQPDFTPDQVKLKLQDYEEDLAGVTADELRDACGEWRRDPLNKFFPKTGELLELVKPKISARAKQRSGAEYLLSVLGEKGGAGSVIDVQARLRELGEKMRATRP